jgi:hypothetical protein
MVQQRIHYLKMVMQRAHSVHLHRHNLKKLIQWLPLTVSGHRFFCSSQTNVGYIFMLFVPVVYGQVQLVLLV